MDPCGMTPYARALLDYLNGDESATVVVRREDGDASDLPASVFFQDPSELSMEALAVDRCRGHVLDVGAGAGRHALVLQGRGMRVTAIDVASHAVEVMQRRGVQDARCVDVFGLRDARFDTILMLCHGIGLVQHLAGLDRFLRHARDLVRPGGQVLLDSLDVRCTENPEHLAYQESVRRAGRYVGEVRMRLEYRGQVGPLIGWLHVDPGTLREHADEAGWACEVLAQEEDGDYLARLTRQASACSAAMESG